MRSAAHAKVEIGYPTRISAGGKLSESHAVVISGDKHGTGCVIRCSAARNRYNPINESWGNAAACLCPGSVKECLGLCCEKIGKENACK